MSTPERPKSIDERFNQASSRESAQLPEPSSVRRILSSVIGTYAILKKLQTTNGIVNGPSPEMAGEIKAYRKILVDFGQGEIVTAIDQVAYEISKDAYEALRQHRRTSYLP